MYRNDIQGLRGLCIIFIIIHNIYLNKLQGNYFESDLFFLISGYVITNSLNKKKTNIINFYADRIKRLFPVSLLCIILSIYLVSKMPIYKRNEEYNNIIYALLSISNYRNYEKYNDYIEIENNSIVNHYWYLSIQNQLYIIIPFILKLNIKHIMIIGIISFIYSSIISFNNYPYAFYSTISKLWIMLIGCLCKLLKSKNEIDINEDLITIIIIILSFFSNLNSLLGLGLGSLILLSKMDCNILNNKFLIFMGNISYPLYLIHYILYVYYNINGISIKLLIIIPLSIMLSYLCYEYIDKRMKHIRINKIIVFIVPLFTITILFSIINLIIYKNKTIKYVSNISLHEDYSIVIKEWDLLYKDSCSCLWNYQLKKASKDHFLLMIGDSHVDQWSKALIPYFKSNNYNIIQIYFPIKHIYKDEYKSLLPYMKFNDESRVVISFCHSNGKKIPSKNHFHFISFLRDHYHHIYFIHDTPFHSFNPNNYISNEINDVPYSILGINSTITYFNELKKGIVNYINMTKYICDINKCPFIKDSKYVYKDSNHLNLLFAEVLSDKLIKNFNMDDKYDNNNIIKCETHIRC